jgi:hypothetical protein
MKLTRRGLPTSRRSQSVKRGSYEGVPGISDRHVEASMRQRVGRVDASMRRRLDASRRRVDCVYCVYRVETSTRRRVDASTCRRVDARTSLPRRNVIDVKSQIPLDRESHLHLRESSSWSSFIVRCSQYAVHRSSVVVCRSTVAGRRWSLLVCDGPKSLEQGSLKFFICSAVTMPFVCPARPTQIGRSGSADLDWPILDWPAQIS